MLAGMVHREGEHVSGWERRTAGLLTLLAVVFLAVYAAPILSPDMSDPWRDICLVANVVIWVLFAGDFVVRLALAPNRRGFLRTHLFDLVVLVLPVLRPLRVLRLVTAVLVLTRRTEIWARGRLALYVGATTTLLVAVAGLAVLDAERTNPDANITSYPEALWWSVVTITTVGYGDHYPLSVTGKLVAVSLMIGGIGLIGFVTGSLASWIVERISADSAKDATKEDIRVVLSELAELRAEVAALREERKVPLD